MKQYVLTTVLTCLSALCLAQAAENPALGEIAELRRTYRNSLDQLLKKYIADGNVATVAKVAAEMKRTRLEMPKVETGDAPVGLWRSGGDTVLISPSGLTTWNDVVYGIWRWTDEKARKFEIRWETGYIDAVMVFPNEISLIV